MVIRSLRCSTNFAGPWGFFVAQLRRIPRRLLLPAVVLSGMAALFPRTAFRSARSRSFVAQVAPVHLLARPEAFAFGAATKSKALLAPRSGESLRTPLVGN